MLALEVVGSPKRAFAEGRKFAVSEIRSLVRLHSPPRFVRPSFRTIGENGQAPGRSLPNSPRGSTPPPCSKDSTITTLFIWIPIPLSEYSKVHTTAVAHYFFNFRLNDDVPRSSELNRINRLHSDQLPQARRSPTTTRGTSADHVAEAPGVCLSALTQLFWRVAADRRGIAILSLPFQSLPAQISKSNMSLTMPKRAVLRLTSPMLLPACSVVRWVSKRPAVVL